MLAQRGCLILAATMLLWASVTAQHIENEGRVSHAGHRASTWYRMVEQDHKNVFDVMNAMSIDSSASEHSQSREYHEAMTWLAKRRAFADENGNVLRVLPNPTDVTNYYEQQKQKQKDEPLASVKWEPIGPFAYDSSAKMATGSMGIGVVRTHIVDPNNSNLIVIGTISSGIWRSTNAGSTWTNVALEHPIQTVSRLAMTGTTIFAATDAGLYASSDKGLTFRQIALVGDAGLIDAVGVDLCAVSPSDSKRLVIAARGRIFLTTNGGTTWASAGNIQGTWWDLRWHATRTDIVYGLVQRGAHIAFVRSTSSGVKFDEVGDGYPQPRTNYTMARGLIAVSPADPQFVSVLIGGGIKDSVSGVYGLYVSHDNGATFEHRCCGAEDGPEPADAKTNVNLFDYDPKGNGLGQITWDMGFAVSTKDTTLMVAAGVFPYRSQDGGRTWSPLPAMHYDIQSASYLDNTIWLTHDGGVTRSTDKGVSIVDRSFGISAMEIWGYDQSHNGNVMALGAYHLPIFLRDTTVYDPTDLVDGWYAWSGADAMGANVNPVASEWIYAKPWTSVRGLRTKTKKVAPTSTDLGIDLGYITLTNLCIDPHHHFTIVACDHDKQRIVISHDNAVTWKTLRQFTNWVYRVRMNSEDGNHLLVLADQQLLRSTNQGVTWVNVTPPESIRRAQGMQDMAYAPDDPQHVFVAFGGQQTVAKVAESRDGGRTWTDVSTGLPSFAIKTLISRRGAQDELYAGTSLGVYKWERIGGWQSFGSGLPISDVNFLQIDEPHGILRAATQRGLWQIVLTTNSLPVALISRDVDTVSCSRRPVRFGCRSSALETKNFSRSWFFPGGEPLTASGERVDVRYSTPGTYDVQLIVSNEYGADTAFEKGAITVVPSACDGYDREPGGAVDLTDPDDHVTLGRLLGKSNAFSFTAWVKPVGMQPGFSTILCSDADAGVEQEVGMQFVNDKNEIGYLWKDGRWWWASGLTVAPDVWSHVAMTIDSTGATVYVNGQGSADNVKLPQQNLASMIMKLGTYHNWSSRNFNGFIDEVSFYDRKLSEEDVRLGMHRTKRVNEPGLIAYYQFNEFNTLDVYDKVGGRDGVRESGASTAHSGALVGDAESELQGMRTGVHRVRFESLGDEIEISNAIDGANVLLTRMLITPDSLPTPTQFIPERSWIVDVFSVDDRIHEVESAITSCDRLIDTADARTRTFQAYTRTLWSTGRDWTSAWTIGKSTYSSSEHALSTSFKRGVSAPHQWAIGVSGGAVGIHDQTVAQTNIVALPQPCSEVVQIKTANPCADIRFYDPLGALRLVYSASESLTTSCDVRSLPAGMYVVATEQGHIPIMILR
ncbi:MAG: PKD domain-containing protein [Candidatus Kapabacteria bacterium]|nr:PKD domain-containing protein [Candidatus Kapabacteria bacterium]